MIFLAYFTDPMGEEFRKAIEQALKDMENEGKEEKKPRKSRASSKKNKRAKSKINHLTKKTREELR